MQRTVKLVLFSGLFAGGFVAACVGDDPGSEGGSDAGGSAETSTVADTSTNEDGGASCEPGKTACGTECFDLKTNDEHCGTCEKKCSAGFKCVDGDCGDSVVKVAGNFNHACALMKNGSLYCWGGNDYGQLGKAPSPSDPICVEKNGTKHSCNPKPSVVPNISDVVDVSSGATDFTCVIKKDGTVWCWGRNQHGQVGTVDIECAVPAADGGVGAPTRCNPSPQQMVIPGVPMQTKAKAFGVSAATGCVLLENGEVHCWAFNDGSRAGIPLESPTTTPLDFRLHPPTKVAFPFEAGPMVRIHASSGLNTTCATASNGKLWCWGKGHVGQVARLPSTVGPAGCQYCTPTPAPAEDTDGGAMQDIVQSATTTATCVRRTDQSIWCFGNNASGELGLGTTDALSGDNAHYKPSKVTAVPATAELFAQYNQFFATDTVGDVWIWGENRYGTLGDGTTGGSACQNGRLACVLTPKKNPALAGMVQISPGSSAVVARKNDGTVWAWGANTQGQLGHTPQTAGDINLCSDDLPCNPTPSKVTIP